MNHSDDIARKMRVVDQMITMHSIMRDSNTRRSTAIDILILGFSIVLVAAVFADPRILLSLNFDESQAAIVLRVSSLIVFFLSLVAFRVDWKTQAWKHQDAHRKLAQLKIRIRNEKNLEDEKISHLDSEYQLVMDSLPPIPEKSFIRLKAKHLRKVEVSKLLSRNPGCPAFWATILIFVRQGRKASQSESKKAK